MDVAKMIENLNVAIVACDADFNATYANPKCKQIFKELLNMENFEGRPMAECHKPKTMEKLKKLFQEYKEHKRKLDYYTMDVPDGKLTIVNVPFYEGKTLAGVVEFIFEGSLA
jgi:PAS domain S-box-containing protein